MSRPDVDRAGPPDVEGRVQLVLTLAVGAVAACASWSHVLDLAAQHGQAGWLAWAVAACIETGAVSAGLEVRRRRRRERSAAFPLGVLIGTTVLQLAAQIAQAEQTPWGVVLAAVPAVTFLTLVKLAISRTSAAPSGGVTVVGVGAADPASSRLTPAPVDAAPASLALDTAGPPVVPTTTSASEPQDDGQDVGDLLLIGRAVADELAREGLALNRRNLLAGIRARGRSCSTERASALLRALRAA